MSARPAVSLLRAGDPADDAKLDAFFEACPTSFAQQTPGWRDVITAIDRDEPLFLACSEGGALCGVLPAYRFEGPLGAILTSVPQAGPLGGVAVHPEADAPPLYTALLDAFAALARERDCALASVITNPIWPDRELYGPFAADFTLENSCLVLDLERAVGADGSLRSASSHVRRNLRQAEEVGFDVDDAASPENVEVWYAIHEARHREIGATPLPRALFLAALEHMVPRGKARFFFVRLRESGAMVGGGFYVHHGGVIDALMPSVASEWARSGANYVLASHSIRWARAAGLHHYNWQGSPPGGGVARFKRQWGSDERSYSYLTRMTGDARPFLESTPQAVRDGYRWHYALPFDRIGRAPDAAPGASERADAWNALETSE